MRYIFTDNRLAHVSIVGALVIGMLLLACDAPEDEKTGDVVGTFALSDNAAWPTAPWQIVVEVTSGDGAAGTTVVTPPKGEGSPRFRLSNVPTGAGATMAVLLRDSHARPGTLGSRIVLAEYGNIDVVEGETVIPEKELTFDGAFDVTFQEIQKTLFEPACNSCHYGGSGSPPELDAENSYDNLVNSAAIGNPDMSRVTPKDADNSYLIEVLFEGGTHQGRISDGQLELLIHWIDTGAPALL